MIGRGHAGACRQIFWSAIVLLLVMFASMEVASAEGGGSAASAESLEQLIHAGLAQTPADSPDMLVVGKDLTGIIATARAATLKSDREYSVCARMTGPASFSVETHQGKVHDTLLCQVMANEDGKRKLIGYKPEDYIRKYLGKIAGVAMHTHPAGESALFSIADIGTIFAEYWTSTAVIGTDGSLLVAVETAESARLRSDLLSRVPDRPWLIATAAKNRAGAHVDTAYASTYFVPQGLAPAEKTWLKMRLGLLGTARYCETLKLACYFRVKDDEPLTKIELSRLVSEIRAAGSLDLDKIVAALSIFSRTITAASDPAKFGVPDELGHRVRTVDELLYYVSAAVGGDFVGSLNPLTIHTGAVRQLQAFRGKTWRTSLHPSLFGEDDDDGPEISQEMGLVVSAAMPACVRQGTDLKTIDKGAFYSNDQSAHTRAIVGGSFEMVCFQNAVSPPLWLHEMLSDGVWTVTAVSPVVGFPKEGITVDQRTICAGLEDRLEACSQRMLAVAPNLPWWNGNAWTVLNQDGVAAGAATTGAAHGAPRRQLVIFGNDPCPPSASDGVIQCVRRPEKERYRAR